MKDDGTREFHDIAEIFPMMSFQDLRALEQDIRENGLREPIVILDGKILDGRNRYLACINSGVEPKFREYDGNGSPLDYVISLNIYRRHMDESQRAMVAGRIATMKRGRPNKSANLPILPTQPEAAAKLNVSERTVRDARQVLESGDKELITAVDEGKLAVSKAAKAVKTIEKEREQASPPKTATFNRTNENIGWAAWSWNPVTGCKQGCPYCYARDIAMRFTGHFNPEFHKDRLDAPKNTNPLTDIKGGNRVFVCSMADLFGPWVPEHWKAEVFERVYDNPKWTFLFLTKHPEKYPKMEFPDNTWIGVTVDRQAAIKGAEKHMEPIKAAFKFVSCEPLQEKIVFNNPEIFNAFIIGARSASTGAPAFQPEWPWVLSILNQAATAKRPVWWKDNLNRPQQL